LKLAKLCLQRIKPGGFQQLRIKIFEPGSNILTVLNMRLFGPLTLFVALVAGAPHPADSSSFAKRATVCGTDDTIHTSLFNVHNFFLGTLGSQCLTVQGQFDTRLYWSTTWSWDGDVSSRKSFVAAQLRRPRFIPVSSIAAVPTELTWRYVIVS
jgi:hypothetical protein